MPQSVYFIPALHMYKVNYLGHIGTVRNPNKTFSGQAEP